MDSLDFKNFQLEKDIIKYKNYYLNDYNLKIILNRNNGTLFIIYNVEL